VVDGIRYGSGAVCSGAKDQILAGQHASDTHAYHIEDLEKFPEYEVEARCVHGADVATGSKMQKQRILDTVTFWRWSVARPRLHGGFIRNTTDFMIDIVRRPEWGHKLIDRCTSVIIDWLKAQAKAMGNTVEGIFILDDIVGFINEEHYQELPPYLKRICDAFPKDWVKIYHNDAGHQRLPGSSARLRFNVLNWGKQTTSAEVKERVGDRCV